MKIFSAFMFLGSCGLCLGAGGGVSTGGSSGGGRFIEGQDVSYSWEDVTYSGQHVVVEGEKISIACVLDVSDFLQWTLNNKPIIPGESGYTMIHGPGRQGYVVSRLTQARARSNHAGEYRCTDRARHSHRVFVISGSLTETEETRLFRKGQPLSLTCTYNVTNLLTDWTKDGEDIVESEHIHLFPNTTLHITSTEESDIGEYTCKHGSMLEPKTFNVVALSLQKRLPKSTTVLENDKLSLTCQVDGKPHPTVQWLKDGEPAQESVNSSRLVLSENEAGISNGSLLINPVLKSDSGNYMCLISQYSIQLNTTTEVRVKDIYAALWPFLGIVAEVVILCTIIYIHERRRIRKNLDEADSDNKVTEQKTKEENKENDVRQRK